MSALVRLDNDNQTTAFMGGLHNVMEQIKEGTVRECQTCEELKAIEASNAPKIVKFLRKLPLITGIFWDLLVLYLIKPIDAEALRGTVR